MQINKPRQIWFLIILLIIGVCCIVGGLTMYQPDSLCTPTDLDYTRCYEVKGEFHLDKYYRFVKANKYLSDVRLYVSCGAVSDCSQHLCLNDIIEFRPYSCKKYNDHFYNIIPESTVVIGLILLLLGVASLMLFIVAIVDIYREAGAIFSPKQSYQEI